MKAIVCKEYGRPAALRLEEVAKPEPSADEILIRVRATAVNDWDWNFVRGTLVALRPIFGLRRRKVNILQAATISRAAMPAMQGLIDVGQIRQGQKALINKTGAAVQDIRIAKGVDLATGAEESA